MQTVGRGAQEEYGPLLVKGRRRAEHLYELRECICTQYARYGIRMQEFIHAARTAENAA